MTRKITVLDPAMRRGSALKTIRADIDALITEYWAVNTRADELKAEILALCAAMGPEETISAGTYTKSTPILDREKASMLAIARNIPIPTYPVPTVDYRELELALKAAVPPEELALVYKLKAASIGKPRRRDVE